jgi:hypothetical protein
MIATWWKRWLKREALPVLRSARPPRLQHLRERRPGVGTHATDRRNPAPSPVAAGKEGRPTAVRRRLDPVAAGFWLGGVALGAAGCIFGALLPYHHPVARVVSVLWWGIYFGCFGAGIGALVGLVAKRNPAPPAPERNDPGKPLGCGLIPQPAGGVRLESRLQPAQAGTPTGPPPPDRV